MKPACALCLLSLLAAAIVLTPSRRVPSNDHGTVVLSRVEVSPIGAQTQGAPAGFGHLPLSFEPNNGQSDSRVRFLSRGAGYTLFLTDEGATLSFVGRKVPHSPNVPHQQSDGMTDSALRMRLVGARREPVISGIEELPGKTNYFRGKDPTRWNANIPNFAKVRYQDVFDGVDLVYYGNQGRLEYDFVVAAGANSGAIELGFSGARGLHIDKRTGDVVLQVGKGADDLRFRKPIAYQEESTGKGKRMIAADYVLDSQSRVRFQLGPYDHTKALVIDPTLSYSTYLGGSSNDYGTSIAVDSAGSVYVTGYTNSAAFPTTGGTLQTACGGGCSGTTVDAFITKLDPTGASLVYSTYLGGSANDQANGIALDAAGDAYVVGQTYSSDFPTTAGAFQSSCGGNNCAAGDAFVAELDSRGSTLLYSTYLGGSGIDQGNGIALDASGDAYIVGYSQSTNFPTTPGSYQKTCTCSKAADVIVSELNPNGTALVYSTYLGGGSGDEGYAIALDASNNAYVTGYTHSTNFPTTPGAFLSTIGANEAGFVTELNSSGSALVYSTYMGGSTINTTPCETCTTSIAVDSSGNAYVTGLTAELNFPTTPGAYQTVFRSSAKGHDAFVTKLNPAGTALVFSTYLGGSNDDGAISIALDSSGNVWVKGNTQSSNFPVTPGAFQTVVGGNFDAFVSELDPTGSTLLYSSYLGGSGAEYGGATRMLVVDNQTPPNVYVTGYTNSTNFPTIAGAFQPAAAGLNDAFVSKFSPSPNAGLAPASLSFGNQIDGTTSPPLTVTLTNTGNENLNVSGVGITGTNGADFAETSSCGQVTPSSTCTISVTFTPTIVGSETGALSVTDDAADSPQSVTMSGVGIGSGPQVLLSSSSLNFGTQVIGASGVSQVVTLSNIGNGALNITSITSSGDYSQVNTCGSSVDAGSNCTITVTFNPTGINTRTGNVTVTDDATTSPQVVSLTGVGTYFLLSPTSVNFGTVAVGTSSSPQAITLTNKASAPFAIRSVSITGVSRADYSQTNTCGSRLTAGASCSITVTFKPTLTGTRSALISVTDLAGGSPQTAALSGTGQ